MIASHSVGTPAQSHRNTKHATVAPRDLDRSHDGELLDVDASVSCKHERAFVLSLTERLTRAPRFTQSTMDLYARAAAARSRRGSPLCFARGGRRDRDLVCEW